ALGEHDDVAGQRATLREMRFEGFDMKEKLSFVVHGAASEDFSGAHLRLEWRRLPEAERLGGLDVVVTVDENRRRAGARVAPFADDDGMARRGVHPGGEADPAQ